MHCLPGHCSSHPHIPSLPPLNVSSVPAGCRQLLETLAHRPAPYGLTDWFQQRVSVAPATLY